jgi:hypothetical protein
MTVCIDPGATVLDLPAFVRDASWNHPSALDDMHLNGRHGYHYAGIFT